MGTVVVGLLVIIAVIFAIRGRVRSKKNRKSDTGCDGCSHCSGCH